MKKKYFYDNITVYKYCKVNELPYSNITYSFRYYMKKEIYSLDKIIEKIISKYLVKRERIKIIRFVNNLEISNKYNFSLISRYLNLDYFAMWKLCKLGFSKKEAFYIVWFLSDKTNKKEKKTISLHKLKDFLSIINNNQINEQTPFMYLITLFKMGNIEASNYLLLQRLHILEIIVKKNMRLRQIKMEYFDDFKQEVIMNEMMLYSKIVLNVDLQIYKYLNIYAKYKVINLVKSGTIYQNLIHLEDEKYDGKTYLDFIDNNF